MIMQGITNLKFIRVPLSFRPAIVSTPTKKEFNAWKSINHTSVWRTCIILLEGIADIREYVNTYSKVDEFPSVENALKNASIQAKIQN